MKLCLSWYRSRFESVRLIITYLGIEYLEGATDQIDHVINTPAIEPEDTLETDGSSHDGFVQPQDNLFCLTLSRNLDGCLLGCHEVMREVSPYRPR